MEYPDTVVIPRAAHNISRSLISPNALKVLYRLKDNGFAARLVGGCVRDLLLGREPKDFDVATDATPNEIKRMFRNCRLVGRRFRLAHLHYRDEVIEVATFRASQPQEEDQDEAGIVKSEEGMILRDNVFGTPREDALRRDFTVNALSYDITDFSIVDHAGGTGDLESALIRTIGDPRVRFTEDPVRMLRGIRFAAQLGFRIDDETWSAMTELAPAIARATPPRLYEEVLKLFLCGEGEAAYQLLRRTGLFAHLFPVFDAWLQRETGGYPHARTSRALERVDEAVRQKTPPSPGLLMAMIFGEFLEESCERLKSEGLPPQPAADQAVAEFVQATAPVVLIPNRTALVLRDILYAPHRLRKVPGRRAEAFAARPSFSDALEYFRFVSVEAGGSMRIVQWWEQLSSGRPETPPAAEAEKPKRRRRRRRKPRAAEPG